MNAKEKAKLAMVVEARCNRIRKMMTLLEILSYLETEDYSAELALQHLLLYVSRIRKTGLTTRPRKSK